MLQRLGALIILTILVTGVAVNGAVAEESTAAPAAAYSAHSLVPNLGADVPVMSDFGERMARGLIYCVGGLLVGLSLYKRWNERKEQATPGSIDILSRRGIGPKTILLVVRAEGKKFFLAQTDGDVKLLAPIEQVATFQDTLDTFDDASTTDTAKTFQAISAAR